MVSKSRLLGAVPEQPGSTICSRRALYGGLDVDSSLGCGTQFSIRGRCTKAWAGYNTGGGVLSQK